MCGKPDQVVGDFYALATCNEIGHRRLVDMMQEFSLDDLEGIASFILENFPARNDRADCGAASCPGVRIDDHRWIQPASHPEGRFGYQN